MDREDNIYRKNLPEQDLIGLADLCANIARNVSADSRQSDTAHALHVEWIRLRFDGSPHNDNAEAENSLKKRMSQFLAEVPSWMLGGV
jgi:hypothetical protein